MSYATNQALAVLMWAVAAACGPSQAAPTAAPASATHPHQDHQSSTRLRALFEAKTIDPSWFNPEFLAHITAPQVQQIVDGLRASFGSLRDMQLSDGSGFVLLEKGRLPVRIGIDRQSRITSLWFGPPQLLTSSLDDLRQDLRAAAVGQLSVYVAVDGSTLIDERGSAPMAVGSAFKLIVLKAYEAAVASGEIKRDQIVTFQERDRSLPSGTLQVLPSGTPVTAEVLAQLMIRNSDNTATDALMRLLGRARLEALSPEKTPFLTTRELFQLTAAGADAVRAAYKDGTQQERQQILADLAAKPLPDADHIGKTVTWPDVEWRLSAKEICELLEDVKDAPAFDAPAHPLFAPLNWQRVSYKGGSELGVLNLSAMGTTPEGRRVCAVVTANGDEAQQERSLTPIFVALIRAAGAQHAP